MITQILSDFRCAKQALRDYHAAHFPNRQLVRVNCSRFHGLGVVNLRESTCPLDEVPVLLGNGNTWFYPIEHVEPSDEPLPRELRHAVLDLAGIAHL